MHQKSIYITGSKLTTCGRPKGFNLRTFFRDVLRTSIGRFVNSILLLPGDTLKLLFGIVVVIIYRMRKN